MTRDPNYAPRFGDIFAYGGAAGAKAMFIRHVAHADASWAYTGSRGGNWYGLILVGKVGGKKVVQNSPIGVSWTAVEAAE